VDPTIYFYGKALGAPGTSLSKSKRSFQRCINSACKYFSRMDYKIYPILAVFQQERLPAEFIMAERSSSRQIGGVGFSKNFV
jgi:hypothetical protein